VRAISQDVVGRCSFIDVLEEAVLVHRHVALALRDGTRFIDLVTDVCMMKEICAQCLQKHRDPRTELETIVFTCFDQDQPMDRVDWENLRARLRANSLQEKLSALWLDRLLSTSRLTRV
jgi:hypothetical protein